MSIFPYVGDMVASFNTTGDENNISTYAGYLMAAFTLAECFTGPLWGMLSDRIGRKPSIMLGLAGTLVSMMMLGFATTLPMAIFARVLGGLLNGNAGIMATMIAELVKEEAKHKARAFSIHQFTWGLGSFLGGLLGGALAQPNRSWPDLFPKGSIFERFPFLLANLACSISIFLSIIAGFLLLEETHPSRKFSKDYGVSACRWILYRFGKQLQPEGTTNQIPRTDQDSESTDSTTVFGRESDILDQPRVHRPQTNSVARCVSARVGVFTKKAVIILAVWCLLAL